MNYLAHCAHRGVCSNQCVQFSGIDLRTSLIIDLLQFSIKFVYITVRLVRHNLKRLDKNYIRRLMYPQSSAHSRDIFQNAQTQKKTGSWEQDEHSLFLEGIELYGHKWKQIAAFVGSRSTQQVRSHAQKYFNRVQKKIQQEENMNIEVRAENGVAITRSQTRNQDQKESGQATQSKEPKSRSIIKSRPPTKSSRRTTKRHNALSLGVKHKLPNCGRLCVPEVKKNYQYSQTHFQDQYERAFYQYESAGNQLQVSALSTFTPYKIREMRLQHFVKKQRRMQQEEQ